MKKILIGFIAIGLLMFVGCDKDDDTDTTDDQTVNNTQTNSNNSSDDSSTDADSDDGTTEIGKIYGAYPMSSEIHIFGGLNREINKTTSRGVTKTYTTGIAYESCCWAIRMAHFQEDKNQGNNSNNYSTGLELILTGLGSTSTPLKGRIESNIPGYSANLK